MNFYSQKAAFFVLLIIILTSPHGYAVSSREEAYRVLGVEQGASQGVYRAAFRKLAFKWHPDRNPENKKEAEATFKKIRAAYEILEGKRTVRLNSSTTAAESNADSYAGQANRSNVNNDNYNQESREQEIKEIIERIVLNLEFTHHTVTNSLSFPEGLYPRGEYLNIRRLYWMYDVVSFNLNSLDLAAEVP